MKMIISEKLFTEIIHSFSLVPPENGGILGSQNGEVCAFCLDRAEMIADRNQYIPNVNYLNEVIRQWGQKGIAFSGMVHSHPENQLELSTGDKQYIRQIMKAFPGGKLSFPLVYPGLKMISYRAYHANNQIIIEPEEIIINKE